MRAVTLDRTTLAEPIVRTSTKAYDLQGRLEITEVSQYDDGALQSRSRSTYDYDATGIRVGALREIDADGDGTFESITDVRFLVDHANHTGYQQVIRESHFDVDGNLIRTVDYTFGHDELHQTVKEYDAANGDVTSSRTDFFLHDGHGDVRALLNAAGAVATIAGLEQVFYYDAYGQMVNMAVDNAATTLLYSGEQTDALTGQQYLRARYYNPNTGQFNRLDDFFGNQHDPQSFHKYAYVHGDPVQGIDPTGMFASIGGAIAVGAIGGLIVGGIIGGIDAALDPNATWTSIGWGILGGAIGGLVFGALGGLLIGTVPLLATAGAVGALAWAFGFSAFIALSGILTGLSVRESVEAENPVQAAFRLVVGVVGIMLFVAGVGAVRTPSRVATDPDTAFFWSGRTDGIGGQRVAAQAAQNRGGTTLEMLIESRGIRMPDWNPNDPAAIQAWANISAEYAQGATGHVRAVVGRDLRPGNIWETFELPALKSNPKVTKITTIDPKTGSETIVFQR